MHNNDLLGALAQAANKQYLSDLRWFPPFLLADIVLTMDCALYSQQQWCYALSYIYDQPIPLAADADIAAVIRQIEI